MRKLAISPISPIAPVVLLAAMLTVVLTAHGSAHAGDWDLKIGRLCQLELSSGQRLQCGGGYTPDMGSVGRVVPDNGAFRALMSELGVVFAPNVLAPAETYGYNGYTMAVEFGFTSINPKKNATNRLPDGKGGIESSVDRYWRAAGSVSDRVFLDRNSRDPRQQEAARARLENELPPTIAPTITLMARKGLWLPVPSFELGLGVRHLIDSKMWAPVVQAKLALHEGFQGFPLPALSVRGMGSHVMNTTGFSLSIAGLDFAISKHIGVASTFNLMPYAGYQLLWIVADSSVVDATPNVDAIAQSAPTATNLIQLAQCRVDDCRSSFTFDDQANILRHRFFAGVRVNFYLASFLIEYSHFSSGSKSDPIYEGLGLPGETLADASGTQHSVNFAIALDY